MKGSLDDREAEFVTVARVGRVATVSPDGMPHVVPICHILEAGKIVFATPVASAKALNLASNPRVCMVFDDYTEMWDELIQVVVQGHAEMLTEGEEFRRYRDLMFEKFPQYPTATDGISEVEDAMVVVSVDGVASDGL